MAELELHRYPLSRRFLVAADGGRSARHVRALAGTADWRRAILDRLGGAAVAVCGPQRLPVADAPAWPDAPMAEVGAELGRRIPGLRITGVVLPRQPGRPRLSVLGTAEDRQVIVKLGRPNEGVENEAAALGHLTETPLPGIATPSVIAAGLLTGDDIAFVATEALGLERQRPAIDEPLTSFESDLARCLADLPRPAGTAADAVPVHGDLAPWNLRRTPRGLALFDWEEVGWAAPGSDLEYYRRACASLR